MPSAAALADVLRDLVAREPIFHRPEHGRTRADFAAMTVEDFWEVGASGRCYGREFVLDELDRRRAEGIADPPWEAGDFACREIAPDNYLLTYRLTQGARLTRRATLWRRTAEGWKIVYHQGTVIQEP